MQGYLPEMKQFVESLPGTKVIDAGCGGGSDTDRLLRDRLNVIGVDFAPNILEQAKLSFPDAADHFMLMDVTALSFPGNSYSGIWCRAVLLHLPPEKAREAVNSFHRVLEPGGKLFIRTMESRLGKQYEAKEKFIVDGHPFGFRYFKTYEEAEVRSMLQEAGFSSIKLDVVPDEMNKPIAWLNAWAAK